MTRAGGWIVDWPCSCSFVLLTCASCKSKPWVEIALLEVIVDEGVVVVVVADRGRNCLFDQ